jgi:prepilin-type N-terminal cleavage/methylation domain-containing protein
MTKSTKGFTLIELLVVIALTGILAAIVYPSFSSWLISLRYKEAARDVASVLRDARARAIATNFQHRVKFVAGADTPQTESTFVIQQANRSYGSSATWTDVAGTEVSFPTNVDMRFALACGEETDPVFISFNPDGTGNEYYICIIDSDAGISDLDDRKKYATGVSSTTTGRVRVRKWMPGSSSWE